MLKLLPMLLGLALLSCRKTPTVGEPADSTRQTTADQSTETRGATREKKTKTPAQTIGEIYETSYAVVIGIDKYQHLKKLKGAVRDAKAIAEVMKSRGFEVTLLLDEQVTKDRLRDLPDELMEKLGPKDRLFFYFAGHGQNNPKDSGFLLPIEAKSWKQGLNMNALITTLNDSEIKQVFYAADACYSGLGIRASGLEDPKLNGPYRDLARKNRFVTLSAGTDGETAMDAYKGPDDDETPHGLFTYYLLDAMSGAADFDRDGWINDVEIYAHINNNVHKEAARFGHPQTPNYAQRGKGRVLFANPKAREIKENREMAEQLAALKAKYEAEIDPVDTVLIPPGSFLMGSAEPEEDKSLRDEDETQHKVRISRPFHMMRTEVTQKLYGKLLHQTPSKNRFCKNCPVETVSWFDAVKMANALSEREGREPCYTIEGTDVRWPKGLDCSGWRLPTEAEWEYAARGGQAFTYAGSDDPVEVAWHDYAQRKPKVGCEKKKNKHGLCDMSGNVWEWVWDAYAPRYPTVEITDPKGPEFTEMRALRGGGWSSKAVDLRVSMRNAARPSTLHAIVGFRLVRSDAKSD